ncbi:MAG TPA: histone deacetylase [Elusimicrobia bacterium]|nr:histone deacetylase [Elusimicrobiota bacterium]
MKIIYSEKAAEYNIPGHPEAPFRVKKTKEFLEKIGMKFVSPNYAKEKDILSVHTEELLNLVKSENFFDADTPAFKGVYEIAMLSAGAGISACDYATKNEFAFSLMRPPGHHAGKNSLGGFCYFNNIAVAVKKLLTSQSKVAILDIDVHHGNGTQDIFLGDGNVIYVSLHQVPLYPGTGHSSEKNCFNFPLPPGTDEISYLKTLDIAIEKIVKFSPEIVGISVGFDTYHGDPLANFKLNKDSYKKIAKKIGEIKAGKFAVLEGGYSQDLPELIENFLEGIEQ